MKPIDEWRADQMDSLADDQQTVKEFFREVERKEVRSRLARKYGVDIDNIKENDSGYMTACTVLELGPVHTSYPLLDGTMIEKADIIDNKLVRSGVYSKNGKKVFTMDPENLILSLYTKEYANE